VNYLFNKYPEYRIIVLDLLTYAGNQANIPEEIKNSDRFEFWYGDINNAEILSELISRSDFVIHLAAESHVARSIFQNRVFFQTDVMGTQAVANAVLKYKNRVRRFIHISTSEVYGSGIVFPMTEDHPLNPCSPYASAKAGADRLVYSYIQTYDIPAVIMRPFNQYGPQQHLEKAIPRFITSVVMGEKPLIHGYGGATRDWVYVKDTCRAIDIVMHEEDHKVNGKTINLGTGVETSILNVARTILKCMDKPLGFLDHIEDRPGQVERHCSSTDKAWELLGWNATTTLEEGIKKTVDWYCSNSYWWEPLVWMRKVKITLPNGRKIDH